MPAMPLARVGVFVERGVGLLVRLRPHDVGDAEPLLVAVVGLDHAQHDHAGADARGAPRRRNRPRGRIPAVSSITTSNFGLWPAS